MRESVKSRKQCHRPREYFILLFSPPTCLIMSIIASPLPEPSAEELGHSQKLAQRIMAEIDVREGFLPFDRYMEMALYEPGLGYYAAGAHKFGEGGDFVTAPETSAMFSQCLARQCADVLEQFERSVCILELGAGTGIMAADILAELEALDCLPDHYYILELSAELRDRQRATLREKVPHLLQSVKWLDALPAQGFYGAVIANEVLDAMPVSLFAKDASGVVELGIGHENGGFVWLARPADGAMQKEVERLEQDPGVSWPEGYRSEFNPQLRGWMAALSDSLTQAAVFLIDYGYPRREYYSEQRMSGTLTCYYRHHAVEAPLRNVGLQDITAHVDFTAVAEAGSEAGLEFEGYTSQAFFLMGCGLEQVYAKRLEEADDRQRVQLSQEVKLLTLPAEMGERFQVIGFTKGLELPIRGFSLQNLGYKL